MSRRVRILVEVDVVIHDEEWEEGIVLDSAADFIGDAIERSEDSYETTVDATGATPYEVDTDDITVWEPADYLGELMTIRRLSKTARNRLRRYDRLPAADRLSLQVARTGRRLRGAVAHVTPQ
jgi:hypothetical protein